MTAVAGLVAVAAGFGLAGYAGAFLAGSVFAAMAMIAVLRPIGIRADFSKIRRSSFWAAGRASIPLGLDTIVATVLFRVDALILAAYKGNDALAVYAISYRLLETILFVAFAVVAAVFPVMSSAESLARVRRAVERGVTVCAAVYVPFAIAAIFRGSGIVNLLFGAKYAGPAQEPLAWLAFAPLLIAYGNIANIALIARRRVFGAVAASMVAMVFNVGLNLAIIPLLGPTGAAIATTASYLLEAIILAVLCARLFGWARIDRSLAESVAAGGLMIAVLVFVHVSTIVDLGAAGTVYGTAWFGLSYRFAPENLAVFRQFFRRGPVADDVSASVAGRPGSSTLPPP
jgi:O-antigen/teichoic acid export membrane protein